MLLSLSVLKLTASAAGFLAQEKADKGSLMRALPAEIAAETVDETPADEGTDDNSSEEAPVEEAPVEEAEEATEAPADETWNSDVDPWADN